MRSVKVTRGRTWAAMLFLVPGCVPAHEDASSLDCSTLNKTFFSKPTAVQMAEFGDLDVESQYAVFICGNQVREPPAIYLATPFAKEGGSVVGFLKAKLAAARGDLTISDIILVFQRMSESEIYKVSGDPDLMKVIEDAIVRVKDAFWRQRCERALLDIRQRGKLKGR